MKESLFLRLKGDYVFDLKNVQFYFDFLDGEKLSCKSKIAVADPLYNTTFNLLFRNNEGENRLKGMLNSLLFPGKNNEKVEEVNYKPYEIYNYEITTNIDTYLIFFEILEEKISSESFDNLIISISSKNNLPQKKIIINIKDLIQKINKNEEILINNKNIEIEGKEFIKFFWVRYWAKKDIYKYIIPDYDIYQNELVKECVNILSEISNEEMIKIVLDEKCMSDYYKKEKQKGFYMGLIIGAFDIFLKTNNEENIKNFLKDNNINIKDENEIREILKDKDKIQVDRFINYVKK